MISTKRFILFLCASFSALYTIAQDKPEFAIATLPDSIKNASDVIVRNNTDIFTVTKPGSATQKYYRVVTVLNDKGKRELFFREFLGKFRKVSDVEMRLYDADGHFLEKKKRSDLEKYDADATGDAFLSDEMILIGGFSTEKYPVTMELSYVLEYNGILEYRDFYPVESNAYIINAEFQITTPKTNKPRFKNVMTSVKPKIFEGVDFVNYTYQVKNVHPYLPESGSSDQAIPHVMISPTYFEMDNIQGDMSSWEQIGLWQKKLLQNTDVLSPERVAFFKMLTINAKSEKEKIAILYEYLQKNCRYVSIQLGIGGWKPFPADFVDQKKYGDCKALTNFMYSMLKAVGIPSNYAIINSGYDEMPVDPNFPSTAFNHVILCVPQGKDSIWLECTSRIMPFGALGNFTENRNALLVTEKGGVLVKTPSSNASNNKMVSHTDVLLNADMSSEVKTTLFHSGEFTSYINQILFLGDEFERKRYLTGRMGFKQFNEIEIVKGEKQSELEQTQLLLKYTKTQDFNAGAKFFFPSRMNKMYSYTLEKMDKRETDYYIEFPFIQNDTTVFHLPEGFKPESLPKPRNTVSRVGKIVTDYLYDATKGTITSICLLQVNTHVIHPLEYADAQAFFAEAGRALQQKIVIRKE